MPSLYACADLGNSRIHVALFEGERILEVRKVSHAEFARGGAGSILRRRGMEAVCYCSVVPSREEEFERRIRVPILKLGRDLRVPVRVRGEGWRPGVDRLCNALAAHAWARGPCVSVDLGTAVNVEFISGKGELVGGLIAPGARLMFRSLRENCEQLPPVKGKLSVRGIGRTTPENLERGVGAAIVGLIREAIQRAERRFGMRPKVIATGGDAGRFRGIGLFDRVDPLLTLRGIAEAYRLSR